MRGRTGIVRHVMILAALAATCLIGGCSSVSWPQPGRGGMAELRAPAVMPPPPPPAAQPPPALARHMMCSLDAFDQVRAGAQRNGQANGAVALASETANRARREYAGSMFGDASRSLSTLDQEVLRLRAMVVPSTGALPECS
jgi:hypothetical protein